MKYTVLIVDDDLDICESMKQLLIREHYHVLLAFDGVQALQQLVEHEVHVIIMDIMMPNMDGLQATLKIRTEKHIPIILLSAKSEDTDIVLGLGMGADDYVTKPYRPIELVARVKSQIRRYLMMQTKSDTNRIMNGGLALNVDTKQLYVDGEEVKLTAKEYHIVCLLMQHIGMVFSAEQIYEKVWKEAAYGVENTVMVHIRHIREKIEMNPKEPKYLKVVWGIGYKIEKV